MFDHLLTGKGQVIIADKGYANKKRIHHLRDTGIFCSILDKGHRNRLLSPKQKRKNNNLSQIRYTVERPFAFAKQIFHYDRCRYYNLARNRFQFDMVALVYNLKRCMTLIPWPV